MRAMLVRPRVVEENTAWGRAVREHVAAGDRSRAAPRSAGFGRQGRARVGARAAGCAARALERAIELTVLARDRRPLTCVRRSDAL